MNDTTLNYSFTFTWQKHERDQLKFGQHIFFFSPEMTDEDNQSFHQQKIMLILESEMP